MDSEELERVAEMYAVLRKYKSRCDKWLVYILELEDQKYYIDFTTSLKRRMYEHEHNLGQTEQGYQQHWRDDCCYGERNRNYLHVRFDNADCFHHFRCLETVCRA